MNEAARKAEQCLGVTFRNKKLLLQALTHPSYLNEHRDWPVGHNERLEYLGDAVLELLVADYLFGSKPNADEGALTKMRSSLLQNRALSAVAASLDLSEVLLVSRGTAQDMSRARRVKQRIASCTLEAVVGALYRDQGFNAARAFVQEILLAHAEAILESKALTDPKSLFQEEAQKRVGITPSYTIVDERGPDHAKEFRVAAMLADQKVAEGKGSSKKDAQQKAAQQALKEKRWAP